MENKVASKGVINMCKDYKTVVLHKELDLIQGCITRMAENSFSIKKWTLTMVAGVLAVSKDFDIYTCTALLISVFMFCYLDAYYLQLERKYRALYDWVLKNRPYSDYFLYNLNPNREDLNKVSNLLGIIFSKTIFVFYLIPFFIIFTIFISKNSTILKCN